MVSSDARKNAKPPQRLKGMTEYRAALTRAAYEKDPEKCLRVVLNIIDKAHDGDAVAMKIFAQSFMTKAPTEMQMTINNQSFLSEASSEKMIAYLVSKGYSKHDAAKRIIEVGDIIKMSIDENDISDQFKDV